MASSQKPGPQDLVSEAPPPLHHSEKGRQGTHHSSPATHLLEAGDCPGFAPVLAALLQPGLA